MCSRRHIELAWSWVPVPKLSADTEDPFCTVEMLRFLERIPLHQLFIVTLLGVSSGVYIYRPLLEEYSNKRKEAQKLGESDAEAVKPENVAK